MANIVYSQDTFKAEPMYVDSSNIKTIDTVGNVKVIQYYHPTETYKGHKKFLGKDKYLLFNGALIESSRIDYEKEITIGYTFFESGELSGFDICQMNGGCDLIYFYKNGKVKSQYSVNSEGLNSGLWFKFDSEGKLIEKRIYTEEGKLIEE